MLVRQVFPSELQATITQIENKNLKENLNLKFEEKNSSKRGGYNPCARAPPSSKDCQFWFYYVLGVWVFQNERTAR